MNDASITECSVVRGSVHKLGYGHKQATATPGVAGVAEAGDCGGNVAAGLVGAASGAMWHLWGRGKPKTADKLTTVHQCRPRAGENGSDNRIASPMLRKYTRRRHRVLRPFDCIHLTPTMDKG